MKKQSDDSVFNLSSKKRALLHRLLERRGIGLSSERQITRRQNRNEPVPLSFAQERFWILYQLDPGNVFYNVSGAIRIQGKVSLRTLKQSLQEIVQRHEVLRTTFRMIDGEPMQEIRPAMMLPLPVIDLRAFPASECEGEMQRLARIEGERPFDLLKGILVRATLLRLAETEYVLLLTTHHIVYDGWSIGLFLQELAALYDAFLNGTHSPLPPLPVQYADYAVWQRQYLQGAVLQKQLAYWKQQLRDAPAALALATDRPRPPQQTFRGARHYFCLSADLTGEVKALSRQESVTLFILLLAVFKVLLYRYTRQEDIIVGTPIAGRNRSKIENLIGCFVNMMALRSDLSGNPRFRDLLQQVRKNTLNAYAHQDLPFEKLVEKLQPPRDPSRTPLFQVLFILQNIPRPSLELSDLSLSLVTRKEETANFDLGLELFEEEEEIWGSFGYNTDLFEHDTIKRLMEHFQILLQGVVANPNARLSHLPLLSETDYYLLSQWNAGDANYCPYISIHATFEAQVTRSPQAVALVCEERQLSYGELNRRANQLARYLQTLGVAPEVPVGICMERSIEMVVTIIAVLKAGGAYVPLDPAYPRERFAFILADSKAPVVLAQTPLGEKLPEQEVEIVYLDKEWESITRQSDTNLEVPLSPHNLAYIIYTSGSTGRPKGVLVTHANVFRLFKATESWFHFSPQDVWTLFHSYAFDFSVWELWGALFYRGKLIVVPYWLSRSPDLFYNLLLEQKVTVLNQTPSAFGQLTPVEASSGAQGLALRQVIFGGETLELNRLESWIERHGDTSPQLVNMYGITETTVHVTYRPLQREDIEREKGSVIGKAIPDLQLHVLDPFLQPVPVGVPGELYVGGAGVARGYLNRPTLTAEKFIPNPFLNDERSMMNDERAAEDSLFLYKTGDLVRYRSDGELVYLGRVDDQVKIRGFRIELGEIEAVLTRHPQVREAAVLVHGDSTDEVRLVAYVVPYEQHPLSADVLRNNLQRTLPRYMVPAAFVLLHALPLTPNGKLDKKALPVPDHRPQLSAQFVAPRDILELQLVRIWEKLLDVRPVGVRDDFFDLGGHSVLAVRLMAQIEDRLGRHLPLYRLFRATTIEQLAALLRSEGEAEESGSPLVRIQPEGEESPFFCVHPAGGNVLCYAALARHLDGKRPFLGLQSRGLRKGEAPFTTIEEMAAYYIEAMRRVQPQGPYALGGWSFGGAVAFEMARQLHEAGQEVGLLAVIDMSSPGRRERATSIPFDDVALLVSLVRDLSGMMEQEAAVSVEALRQVAPAQRLDYVFAQIREHNLLPPDADLGQVRRLWHVFKANLQALRDYHPQRYPLRLVLLRAAEENETQEEGMLGWEEVATAGVEVKWVPGDHYSIMREPHVQTLAGQLQSYLASGAKFPTSGAHRDQ